LVAAAVVGLVEPTLLSVAVLAEGEVAVLGGLAILSVQVTSLRHLPSLWALRVLRAHLALLRLAALLLDRAVRAVTRNLERMYMRAVAVAVGRVHLLRQAAVAAVVALELRLAALELPLVVRGSRLVAPMAALALLEAVLTPHLTALGAEDALRRAYHLAAGITW
jgi:hypothetical protein